MLHGCLVDAYWKDRLFQGGTFRRKCGEKRLDRGCDPQAPPRIFLSKRMRYRFTLFPLHDNVMVVESGSGGDIRCHPPIPLP